jgi:hypothetical protein
MTATAETAPAPAESRKRTLVLRGLARLETVLEWAIVAPFLFVAAYIVLVVPAYAALKATEWTISTDVLALEIAAVTALMGLTLAGLRWAFARRRLLEHTPLLHWSGRFEPMLRIVTVVAFALASFSALTAVLYSEGALDVRPALSAEAVMNRAVEFYAWHLADSVPLVDITGNLQWNPRPEFDDRMSGFLIIVFTGVVILPLIPAVRLAAAGRRDSYESAVVTTLRKKRAGWRTRSPRDRNGGRHVAVVEQGAVRILVDVMRGVWTAEPALRRLEDVPRALIEEGVRGALGQNLLDRFAANLLDQALDHGGYLLVVDAIGDRARDAVERGFGASEIPARLVIWRTDEPDELARVVNELLGELIPETTSQSAPEPAGAS